MATIQEDKVTPEWVDDLYQIEMTDPVTGGSDGVANRQAKQLGQRTQWLKKVYEDQAEDFKNYKNKTKAASSTAAGITKLTDKVYETPEADDIAVTPKGVAAALSTSAYTVNSIEDLREYSGESMISLKGYYPDTPGFAAGLFVLSDDDTAADNGGTVIRTAAGKVFRRATDSKIDVREFGVKFDGKTDDTDKWVSALNYCRENAMKLFCPAGTSFVQTDVLDVSGVSIEGTLKGYLNREGTIIKGIGTSGVVLNQKTIKSSDLSNDYQNLSVQGGRLALRFGYAVNISLTNIFIENTTDGIELGQPDLIGVLWNAMKNCQVRVSGRALYLGGRDFANSNVIQGCIFNGSKPSHIGTQGGYGAVGNVLIATEFASTGVGKGLVLENTANTSILNGYFESKDTSITFRRNNHNVVINDPTFSVLSKQGAADPSYMIHESGGLSLTINGGRIFAANDDTTQNLALFETKMPSLLSGVRLNGELSVYVPNGTAKAIGYRDFRGVPVEKIKGEYTFVTETDDEQTTLNMATFISSASINISGRVRVKTVLQNPTDVMVVPLEANLGGVTQKYSLGTCRIVANGKVYHGVSRLSNAGNQLSFEWYDNGLVKTLYRNQLPEGAELGFSLTAPVNRLKLI